MSEPVAGDSVRASESPDDPSSAAAALPLRRVDVPQDPRLPGTPPNGPTDRLPDPYCVIINETWYNQRLRGNFRFESPPAVALRWRAGCYGEVAGKRGS